MAADIPGRRLGFRKRLADALRTKKPRKDTPARLNSSDAGLCTPVTSLQVHRAEYRENSTRIDTQLGEDRDYTTTLHALSLYGPLEDTHQPQAETAYHRPPGEPVIASLHSKLWNIVAGYLNPIESANLALSSKTLYHRLGSEPWKVLNQPENYHHKINLLASLDRHLPHHLLCFPCGKYHIRTQEGHEKLQPAGILNPLFDCPNARNVLLPPPRHRITHSRTLPFSFVQLVMRAYRFSEAYGISVQSLSRRWRRDGWSFNTRYLVHNGRLLMRVVSSCFAPPGLSPSAQRLLLYSRDDYWPYFSVCAHWRDGELMTVCKCSLGHIPRPRDTAGYQGIEAKMKDAFTGQPSHVPIVSLCEKCRPKRRCPECPTEYLIEIKLMEDKSDIKRVHFKHAIIVTRWSDLGDGTSPMSPEWAACNGVGPGYDSFTALGKRALSGIFESAFTHDTIPGQRVISLNPDNRQAGEDGDDWY